MPNASPFVVPFKKPRLVGRDELLRALHQDLQTSDDDLIPAVTGQAGVGKTQFAALYIHTYRAAFPGGVFWLDLTHAHPARVLRQIGGSFARALGLTSEITDPAERDRDLSEQWLGHIRNNPSVLIVADSLNHRQLLHELPGLSNSDITSLDCKVVVTTRLRDLPGCKDIHIDVFDFVQGETLLLSEARITGSSLDTAEKNGVAEVFRKLGGLPLTLRLAGALVREEKLTFTDVAAALSETGVIDVFDAPSIALEDYQTNVSKALSRLIADSAGAASSGGADLMHALKVIASFPENAILRYDFLRYFIRLETGRLKRGDRFARVIRDLHRRNLVDFPVNAVDCIRLHNLIHEYVRRSVDEAFLEDVLRQGAATILDPTHLLSQSSSALMHLAQDISLLTQTSSRISEMKAGDQLATLQQAIERQTFHLDSAEDSIQQLHYQAIADRAFGLALKLQAALCKRNAAWFMALWSTSGTDPSLVRTFRGHQDWVRSCSFDKDGRRALSASSDRTLVLWDVATGDTIHTLQGHSAAVFSQCFSGPNDNALSASLDQRLILWDLESGQPQRCLEGHRQAVIHCSVSAEGARGLSASEDRQLVLWDLRSGSKIRELRAPDLWSSTCLLHPDGNRIVFGMSDGDCLVIDLSNETTVLSLRHHVTPITCVSLSNDGCRILTASMDGTVVIWDLETGRFLRQFRDDDNRILSCALDAHGKRAIATAANGAMALWDLETGDRVLVEHGHHGPILSCSLSLNGEKALSGSTDGALMLWDLTKRRVIGERSGHQGAIWCCKLSPDGDFALSGGNDGFARLWNTGSGLVDKTLGDHGTPIHDCALNFGNTVALTAGADGYLRRWDPITGAETGAVPAHQGPVIAIDISSDGTFAVSAGSDHTTCLWSIETDNLTPIIRKQSSLVRCCAFSSDGSKIVLGLSDGLVILWDRTHGAPTRTLRGHGGGILACAFADNDRFVVTASADGTIRRWPLAGSEGPFVVNVPGGALRDCGFRSDGRMALTVCGFRTIALWDLEEARTLVSLSLDALTSVAFSSNGKCFAVGDGKGDLSFFRIET